LITSLALVISACAVDSEPAGDEDERGLDGKADGATAYVVIGSTDTYLKQLAVPSDELALATQKCEVPAGTRLELQGSGTVDGTHVKVNTRELLPGCGFSLGYLYVPHVASASFRLTGTCAGNLSPSACALLGTIAYAEGTGDRYDIIFGYQYFTSYANHPRRLVCSNGYCSDAAGRYQFLSTTWDGIRAGLPDFGPASQDQAALRLIRQRGVNDVDGIDTYSELSTAIVKLNLEWASLPGSPYGQPTKSMASLWETFRRLRGI
jgi:muramidase (phage lysozyme)